MIIMNNTKLQRIMSAVTDSVKGRILEVGEFNMRKMEMPVVDVIRFNESDVIVASGGLVGKTLSIRGVGDGQKK